MEKIKYIYFDDMYEEALAIIKGFINDYFEIKVQKPTDIGKIVDVIYSLNYNGIILDQRLDRNPKFGKVLRGTSIAQHLRTISSEDNKYKSVPIILFTAQQYQKDFNKDSTARDLFDKVYLKEQVSFDEMQKELICLAKGYNRIDKIKDLSKLLNIDLSSFDKIDYRFISELKSMLNEDQPNHVFALFFLNEVLFKNGVLIDENTFAARLGADISDIYNWDALKKIISDTKYTGVFSEGWNRWWMFKIENWWSENFKDEKLLNEIGADERIKIINTKYNLKLKSAKKTDKSSSDMFWTICVATKRPLDIVDGILIKQTSPEPWQDELYISIDELIKELKKGIIWDDIHPSDIERAEEIKKLNIKKRV